MVTGSGPQAGVWRPLFVCVCGGSDPIPGWSGRSSLAVLTVSTCWLLPPTWDSRMKIPLLLPQVGFERGRDSQCARLLLGPPPPSVTMETEPSALPPASAASSLAGSECPRLAPVLLGARSPSPLQQCPCHLRHLGRGRSRRRIPRAPCILAATLAVELVA